MDPVMPQMCYSSFAFIERPGNVLSLQKYKTKDLIKKLHDPHYRKWLLKLVLSCKNFFVKLINHDL